MSSPSPLYTAQLDRLLSPTFLRQILRNPAISCASLEPFQGSVGLSCELQKLTVHTSLNDVLTYVVKSSGLDVARIARSKALGLAREASWFVTFPDSDSSAARHVYTPRIFYSWGSMETGEKLIVMEDLSQKACQSGLFFGPGSPLNWGKDDAISAAKNRFPGVTLENIVEQAVVMAARQHGASWLDRDLLKHKDWLRGVDFLNGDGQQALEASHDYIRLRWQAAQNPPIAS